jgi:hypothetical protein
MLCFPSIGKAAVFATKRLTQEEEGLFVRGYHLGRNVKGAATLSGLFSKSLPRLQPIRFPALIHGAILRRPFGTFRQRLTGQPVLQRDGTGLEVRWKRVVYLTYLQFGTTRMRIGRG